MLLGILVVFVAGTFILLYQDVTAQREEPGVTEAKRKAREQDVYWYSTVNRIAYALFLLAALVGAAALTYSIAKARLKKAAIHTYKIGKHSEVSVHENDLATVGPQVAIGLTQAEQLKQQNKGLKQAFAINMQMAEMQRKQAQMLTGKRGQAAPAGAPQALPPTSGEAGAEFEAIPSFHQLLISGEIASDKPMILGFQDGAPRRGSFLDIYSAAVAGESGSGKTSTMLFLIGSGLVTCGVRFIGIDPHYPHPKSLGAKTRPLWDAGLMYMATSQQDIVQVLHKIEALIDRRLKQADRDTTPVVLVIDELAFLSKTPIGAAIAHTMERISTEGRKCDIYMLASSQTWLAARTGNSSVVRDTLTSAYVHRIKPKQANLLLQDKSEVEKVKRYIKQAGEVLFCPVNDDSTVCRMPYTTEADIMMVAEMLQSQQVAVFPRNDPLYAPVLPEARPLAIDAAASDPAPHEAAGVSSAPLPQHTGTPPQESDEAAEEPDTPPPAPRFKADFVMVKALRERMHASPLDDTTWIHQLSSVSGVSEKLIGGLVGGTRDLSLQTARKLIPKMTVADEELQHDATLIVVAALRQHQQAAQRDEKDWRKSVAQGAGVSENLLKDLMQERKELSAQTAKKLIPFLWA